MDTTITQSNESERPKTMADLLPELTNLLSQDTLILTAKKKPCNRTTIVTSCKVDKFKPLTIAEMRADIEAIKGRPGKQAANQQSHLASMRKRWNTSVKVDKRINHTKDDQSKFNPVRKVLNFHTKPQASMRPAMNTETPKFPKPEARPKKSVHHLKARDNNVRISGVYKIPETPSVPKPVSNRFIVSNKENVTLKKTSVQTNISASKKIMPPPRLTSYRKTIVPKQVPDTPLSNDSWKSSCDASFLQREKEIQDGDLDATKDQNHSDEISPPASTPFKQYRSVNEYINNSTLNENSINDTISCFDRVASDRMSVYKESREESVIVSLCDMFNKAAVTNNIKTKSELEVLLEMKNETESNIKSQTKLLERLNRLIKKKQDGSTSPIFFHDITLTEDIPKVEITSPKSPILGSRCSVIKSPVRSPTYRIPKKNGCLRKKVFHKSMPEMCNGMQTPKSKIDVSSKALTVYMKMKDQMQFLKTPAKNQPTQAPDTPAITSHNLQKQLDKLFNNTGQHYFWCRCFKT